MNKKDYIYHLIDLLAAARAYYPLIINQSETPDEKKLWAQQESRIRFCLALAKMAVSEHQDPNGGPSAA